MYDVITIGAGIRDAFLMSDQFQLIASDQFSTGMGECVALGSKIEVNDIVLTTGGGATNAAVTFARLGFKTATVCRVGDDASGRDVLADLKREKVATSLVNVVKKGETGYSTLLTASNGERTALTYRGVSATFGPKDVPLTKCKASWFYVTSLAGNLALVKRIAAQAKACDGAVAWNPGRGEIDKGMKAVRPLLPHIRVLIVNREEAARLTEEKEVVDMLDALETDGNVVVITDGDKGAYARGGGWTAFSGTNEVRATSRTGAGDAFGSGFVAALMKTGDLADALATGTLNAESVIQHIGAKAGILAKWPSKKNLASVAVKTL